MRLTLSLFALLALGTCGQQSSIPVGSQWETNDAVLVSVSKGLPQCGVIFSLGEMNLRTSDDRHVTVYVPCGKHPPSVLKKEATCFVRAESSNAEEATTTIGKRIGKRPVLIAREIVCGHQKLTFEGFWGED